jgi:large-conductance mechanosensitive channel
MAGENRSKGRRASVVRLLVSAGALLALSPFLVFATFILSMFAWAVGFKFNDPYLSLALDFVIIASMIALMVITAIKAYQEAPKAAGRIYRFVKEDIEEFLEEARKYAEG